MKNAPKIGRSRERVGTTAGAAHRTASTSKLPTPRLNRLALALLRKSCTIRDLHNVVPSNSVPAYIMQLRGLGVSIVTDRVPFTTVDGTRSWFGKYRIASNKDRAKLQAMTGGGR